MKKLVVNGQIWVELSGQLLIGEGRNQLLENIREQGSISQAAKAMDINYKCAWLMVKEMNKYADGILVEKSTGGIHGGGAKLTNEGLRVINLFNRLSSDFEKFKIQYDKNIRL